MLVPSNLPEHEVAGATHSERATDVHFVVAPSAEYLTTKKSPPVLASRMLPSPKSTAPTKEPVA